MILAETFTFYFLLFFLIELKKLIKLHISRINSANNLIKLSITPPKLRRGFVFLKCKIITPPSNIKKEEECISPNTYFTAIIKTKYFNYIITKRCKIAFLNFKKIKKPIYK